MTAIILILAACSKPAIHEPSGPTSVNQAMLDDVLKQCDWRKEDGFVGIVNANKVQFVPERNADYRRVACVLEEVRQYFPAMRFVGKARYHLEKEQK